MLSQRRQMLLSASKAIDVFSMTAWFLIGAAFSSREVRMPFNDFLSLRISVRNFAVFLGFLFAWHVTFGMFGLYQSRRLSTRREEIVDVLKATSLAVALVAAVAQILQIRMATPLFLSVFWIGSSGTMVLVRIFMRAALAHLRKRGRNLRNILIVGANPRGIQFAQKLESDLELGYRVGGFVDDPDRAHTEAFKRSGYPLLTDLPNFRAYVRNHVVDEAAVFLPLKSLYLESARIIEACEEHGIVVRVPAQQFDLALGRAEVEPQEGGSTVTIYTGAMQGAPTAMKRLIDIFLSASALAVLLPFFLVVAIVIKVTSNGSIFFVQERVGLNKRRFKLYKFRTMVADAEKKLAELEYLNEAGGPAFKIRDDPRVTKVGKLLRKTSIDELPQLINVLKGDMSLVGPRPLPVRDYEGFDEDWHRRRFSVRPGITCLWQVNGRSSVPFQKWMELDMEYIDKWSLWLDLKIILKTVPAVLKGAGAS